MPLSHHTIEIRVTPRHLRWEVSVDGVTRRLIDWLCTQDRAIDHALELARDRLAWVGDGARAVVIVQRLDHTEEQRLVVGAQSKAS